MNSIEFLQQKKEARDAIVACGFNPPPISERVEEYHWEHGGIIIEGCESCEEREWSHANGDFPHTTYHQGCVACAMERPDLPRPPKWMSNSAAQ